MTHVEHVTDDDFETEVLEAGVPVLVDFTANWCPPCRAIAPVLEEIQRERADIRVVKLDVDRNPLTAVRYGVQGLPTLILFEHGAEIRRIVGALPKPRLLAEVDLGLARPAA